MTLLPVVERELRVAARRRSTYWTRIVSALVAVCVASVVVIVAGGIQGKSSGMGGTLLMILTVMAFGFCALAGVFLTADCLSEEKRGGTLGLLFLTDLKGYDVVLGKLMATSLGAFYGLLAIFPVLAITLTMGGVTAGEFWRLVLVFSNTLLFSLSAGMLISALSWRDNAAMNGTFGLILLIAVGLPLVELGFVLIGSIEPLTISLASPLTACRLAFDSGYWSGPQRFWQSLLCAHVLSWLFLLLASVVLPSRWQEEAKVSWPSARPALLEPAVSSRRAAKRTELLDVNPVFWLMSRNQSAFWYICAGSVLLVVAAGLIPIFARTGTFPGYSYGVSLLALPVKILVGLHACRFFVEARRTGILELLLCTPLTVQEILRGQWLALRRLYFVPVLAVLCLFSLPIVLAVISNPRNIIWPGLGLGGLWAFQIVTFAADVLAIGWLGMLLGLTVRKLNLAPGLTLLFGVLLPLGGMCLCIPSLFIDIPLLFWARDKLHRELRSLITKRYIPTVPPLYGPGGRRSAPIPPVIRS